MPLIVNNQNVTKTMIEGLTHLQKTIKQYELTSKDLTSSLMFKIPLARPSLMSIFVSVPSKMPYAEYGRKIKALANDIRTIQEEVMYGDKKTYEGLVQCKGRTVEALSLFKAEFGKLVKRIENDLTNNMQDTQITVTHVHLPPTPTLSLAQYIALAARYIKLIKDYWDDIQCILQLIASIISLFSAIIKLANEIVEHVKRIIEMASNVNISTILKQLLNQAAIKALLKKELDKQKVNIILWAKKKSLKNNLTKSQSAVDSLSKQSNAASKISTDTSNYLKENATRLAQSGGAKGITVNSLPETLKNSLIAEGSILGLEKYGNIGDMSLQKLLEITATKKKSIDPVLQANIQNVSRATLETTDINSFELQLSLDYNKDMLKYLNYIDMSSVSPSLQATSKKDNLAKLQLLIKKPTYMVDSSGKFTIDGLVYYISQNPNMVETAITADICLAYTEGRATESQKNYLNSLRNSPVFRDIAPSIETNSKEKLSEVENTEAYVNKEFLRVALKEASGKKLSPEEKAFKESAAAGKAKEPNEQITPDTQSSKKAPEMLTKQAEQDLRTNPTANRVNENGIPEDDLTNFVFNDTGWTPDLTTDYFTGERKKRTYMPGILITEEDITKFDKYVIFTSKLHPYQRLQRQCDLDILDDLIPIMKQELQVEQNYLGRILKRLFSSDD